MAEVMSRSQTIAVGGTKVNRSLAIAAPNCTEMIPATTSQAAGILFRGTGPLCHAVTQLYPASSRRTWHAPHVQREQPTVRGMSTTATAREN